MEEQSHIYLGGERISTGGHIELMKCANCDFNSYRLILHSDTDMVYVGVVGLTDLNKRRLLIKHVSRREYNDSKKQIPKGLEQRINQIFNTDSFVYFDQTYFIHKESGEKIFRPICPKCSDYLIRTSYESFDDFIRKGGQVISMDVHMKQ